MSNPTLKRKSETVLTVSPKAKELFRVIYREQNKPAGQDESPKIRVSELISKMAFYYEKIRNSVDYKEENLHRKNAIERIFKRQVVIEGSLSINEIEPIEVARNILVELIRGGYLPNNSVPEEKVDQVAKVIVKYLKLRKSIITHHRGWLMNSKKNEHLNWIFGIAASELEEILGRGKVDRAIMEHMYEVLKDNIQLPQNAVNAKDKDIQIYISIYRNYLKFDDEMLGQILFNYYNASWKNPTDEEINKIGLNIIALHQAIVDQLNHPLKNKLLKVVKQYTVYFTVLKDVVEEDPVATYEDFAKDPKAFPRRIKQVCERRYGLAKKKLWRAAFRSIIYIFLTKSVFAVLLEVPASAFFNQQISLFSLAINITFPATLLFVIVLFTKLPGDANSAKIVEGVNELVFKEKARTEPIVIREATKRSGAMNFIFKSLYTITMLVSFSFVIWTLLKINFNWVSIIIFLFFLAFVSFFSIRIRRGASELVVTESKESIIIFLLDFFYIPIVQVGKWLSEKFSHLNVFVFVLDFIIEAPFKIFIQFSEEWAKYVKERKDDIV